MSWRCVSDMWRAKAYHRSLIPALAIMANDSEFYKCSVCCKTYSQRFNLLMHSTGCGRYKIKFGCILCGSEYATHVGLTRHQNGLHAGINIRHLVVYDYDTGVCKFVSYIIILLSFFLLLCFLFPFYPFS